MKMKSYFLSCLVYHLSYNLCFPHQPELEDISSSSTLDVLISRVELSLVKLILLEKVCRCINMNEIM